MSRPLYPHERQVLSALVACSRDDLATSFADLIEATGLERGEIRHACAGLRDFGFASFTRARIDAGEPIGAGYVLSDRGLQAAFAEAA